MDIADIINKHGEQYAPYMSGLVNHLPMAQYAMHTIKLTYTCEKLDRLFDLPELKEAALHKIKGV